jgi:hypothetical protein
MADASQAENGNEASTIDQSDAAAPTRSQRDKAVTVDRELIAVVKAEQLAKNNTLPLLSNVRSSRTML